MSDDVCRSCLHYRKRVDAMTLFGFDKDAHADSKCAAPSLPKMRFNLREKGLELCRDENDEDASFLYTKLARQFDVLCGSTATLHQNKPLNKLRRVRNWFTKFGFGFKKTGARD